MVHSLWNYAKNKYTTHRIKDLVNIQTTKYREIIENMQKNITEPNELEYLEETDIQNMNHELAELIQSSI